MNNKWLGGGDFVYDPGPPVTGQRGIKDATGLNNIGLLVRTTGKVTALDTTNPAQWFRIDDGSNVQTTVAYPPFAYAVDDYVTISGISSCEVDGNGDLQRVLRPQHLTCTIEQATTQSDPTNTSPVNFTVTYSEPVTGFDDIDDVTISGTAGGTKTVTITQTDSEGEEYNVAVSDLTYGTVIATVPAGKVVALSGVGNYESTSTDHAVDYCDSIVYVQTPANGGSDSNSGWRWDNAKATVGAALQTAVQYGQTQVWVAKGTYNERITLPAGVALYGDLQAMRLLSANGQLFPDQFPT